MPALRFLLSQQDPDHGCFYALKAAPGEKKRSDTTSSGIAGIACLATGQIDAAKKLAVGLEKMIEMQPAPGDGFYTTIEANGELGTDFPEDETWWRLIDTKQKDQCWYAVGLPFTFFVFLHQATGEQRYAELAEWFFDFQTRCVNAFERGSVGKAGWGCSVLYRTTGDERYHEPAIQMCRDMMMLQGPEGWFFSGGEPAYGAAAPSDRPEVIAEPGDIDGNAEVTCWLAPIASNLDAWAGD
jgi:hypothetical protein